LEICKVLFISANGMVGTGKPIWLKTQDNNSIEEKKQEKIT